MSTLFDVGGGAWRVVKRTDALLNALADRHYPRRAVGCGHVGGPGNVLVLRAVEGVAGWITLYTQFPDDGLDAWRCTMFRNEGSGLASVLIVDAMAVTAKLWKAPPPDGWVTYIDTAKVKGPNPGYCFKRAGWWLDRTYRRRRTLIRLRAAA